LSCPTCGYAVVRDAVIDVLADVAVKLSADLRVVVCEIYQMQMPRRCLMSVTVCC